jgi:hypothetical protein
VREEVHRWQRIIANDHESIPFALFAFGGGILANTNDAVHASALPLPVESNTFLQHTPSCPSDPNRGAHSSLKRSRQLFHTTPRIHQSAPANAASATLRAFDSKPASTSESRWRTATWKFSSAASVLYFKMMLGAWGLGRRSSARVVGLL